MSDVPAESLTASAHVTSSKDEIKFDRLDARLAGAQVKADGTIRPVGDRDADIRFELNAESLMRLRKGLPEIKFAISGNYLESRNKLELKDFKSRLGGPNSPVGRRYPGMASSTSKPKSRRPVST